MKRGKRIVFYTAVIALCLYVVLIGGVKAMLSRILLREVNRVLVWLPEGEASCGNIQVGAFTGTAVIEDVRYTYHSTPSQSETVAPGIEVVLERIEIERLFLGILSDKRALLQSLNIINPRIELWIDEEQPERSFPDVKQNIASKKDSILNHRVLSRITGNLKKDSVAKPKKFVYERAEVKSVNLKNAVLALHSTRSKLDVAVEGLSATVHDLAYDSVFSYCDSIYRFALSRATVMLPDGINRITTQDLAFENRGLLTMGATCLTNKKLRKKATDPAADIRVERMEIGPLSHSILSDKQVLLRTINIIGPKVELWMDEENPEKCFPVFKKKADAEPMTFPFERAELQNLNLKKVDFILHSTRSRLDVDADNLSLELHRLVYDSLFRCDSVFDFSLAHASVVLPDGTMRLKTENIVHSNRKGLSIGATHVSNLSEEDRRQGKTPGADIYVDGIQFGSLSFAQLLHRQVYLPYMNVLRPKVELWIDEQHPELCFATSANKGAATKTLTRKSKKKSVSFPFTKAVLQNLFIEEATLALHSTVSQLDVVADSCTVLMHRLTYDNVFSCDTVFGFALAHASVLSPDGTMRLESRDILHRDASGLSIGATSFTNRLKEHPSQKVSGADIRVEGIHLGPLSYTQLLNKKAVLQSVSVIRPQVEVWMDEKHPEECFALPKKKGKKKKQEFPFSIAQLHHLNIYNASLALHSTSSKLDVAVDSCSVKVQDLAYSHRKSFSYCDSLYQFSLRHFAVMLPDGRMSIDSRYIEQQNGGALTMGNTRIGHTMQKLELGDMVQEPVTWISMAIESVRTSAFNPIRKILSKDYTLDYANVVIANMDIVRDVRYSPKHPFPMVQQAIENIKTPFCINKVEAEMKTMDIAVTIADINSGILNFSALHGTVENITNRKNATVRAQGYCPIAGGQAKVEMTMTNNSACDFSIRMHAESVNGTFFNSLIRPLVGMTCEMTLDSLDTYYAGNKTEAKGTFRLLYNGLKVKVHKDDDVPFKVVTKHAGAITAAANTLIPHSNPLTEHGKKKAFNVQWKRDEWKSTALYVFGPCIDGIKKTFLPGLYVKDRTKIVL